MVVRRRGQPGISHHRVSELPDLLGAGDLLVANDSAVVPARIRGRRETGGRVELLVIPNGPGPTECLLRSSKGVRAGERLSLSGGMSVVVDSAANGRCHLALGGKELLELLAKHGEVPLPPYIDRPPVWSDRDRYQTVYAKRAGSVAAPTAGLHLTHDLIARLDAAGIGFSTLTLTVGPGTFTPLRPGQTSMEAERCEVTLALADVVNRQRAAGGRLVAVGTTSVRTLETAVGPDGTLTVFAGHTDLFIRPGHRFSAVDALLTNFHLPGTTLLGLVAAFAGTELTEAAYREAVDERYRFYSYGDAMLVL